MNYILFDDALRINLLPFTYTRPCAAIRTGILTISEKWERHLNTEISYLTMDYLQGKFPIYLEEENIYINGRLLPDADIIPDIMSLKPGQALCLQDVVLAYNTHVSDVRQLENAILLNSIHQIFTLNPSQIESDFKLITKDKTSASLSATNTVIGNHPVFLEEGVKAECAIFNTSDGPIYLGFESEVMEGAIIRGPFALCEHAGVKMGAKIYSGTTVGPHSKVGGEISNSVILGYSNKGHDGFLGNSVIGEWCNIGADSNNSNLKNNYEEVKLWHYGKKSFVKTGLQFCGLFMGDHSKCGINTMFNTGTVVGVSANIFGSGFPRNFVPSFSWGGSAGFETYQTKKAFETAERVMERRKLELTEDDKEILMTVFNEEKEYRVWEKA